MREICLAALWLFSERIFFLIAWGRTRCGRGGRLMMILIKDLLTLKLSLVAPSLDVSVTCGSSILPPSLCSTSSSSAMRRTLLSPKWGDFVPWVAWLLQGFPQLWVGDWIRTWTLHQNHFWEVGAIIWNSAYYKDSRSSGEAEVYGFIRTAISYIWQAKIYETQSLRGLTREMIIICFTFHGLCN